MKKVLFLVYLLGALSFSTTAQVDSLMAALDNDSQPKNQYATATFKGTRVINGQSIENPGKGVLQFLISHRFGRINTGAYNFFGLDYATIRLGLDYGISNRLAVGVGRSSLNKAYDGYAKFKILRQSKGVNNMPITLVAYSNLTINTQRAATSAADIPFSDRLISSNQLLIARKFSDKLSLQLMPTYIHRNFVNNPSANEEHDVMAMGAAGRLKLTKRFSLTAEYYYVLSPNVADLYTNSLAIGFDIETGGHVFQIHVTNSNGMIESQFIPGTTGEFFKGDIQIGFNISRVFTIAR